MRTFDQSLLHYVMDGKIAEGVPLTTPPARTTSS
jgi:hypothetical protein